MLPQTQLIGAKQPDLSLWMPMAKQQRLKVKQDKHQHSIQLEMSGFCRILLVTLRTRPFLEQYSGQLAVVLVLVFVQPETSRNQHSTYSKHLNII